MRPIARFSYKRVDTFVLVIMYLNGINVRVKLEIYE